MDKYITWIRRAVFIVIAAAVFMPTGALIYKIRSEGLINKRIEQQDIRILKFEYLEGEAWKTLNKYIQDAKMEAARLLIDKEIEKRSRFWFESR